MWSIFKGKADKEVQVEFELKAKDSYPTKIKLPCNDATVKFNHRNGLQFQQTFIGSYGNSGVDQAIVSIKACVELGWVDDGAGTFYPMKDIELFKIEATSTEVETDVMVQESESYPPKLNKDR